MNKESFEAVKKEHVPIREQLQSKEQELIQNSTTTLARIAERYPRISKTAVAALFALTQLYTTDPAKAETPQETPTIERQETQELITKNTEATPLNTETSKTLRALFSDGAELLFLVLPPEGRVTEQRDLRPFFPQEADFAGVGDQHLPIQLANGVRIPQIITELPKKEVIARIGKEKFKEQNEKEVGEKATAYYDSFGNVIIHRPKVGRDMSLEILLSQPFADKYEPEEKIVPISVDLSRTGYGVLEHIIYAPTIEPFAKMEHYYLYADHKQNNLSSHLLVNMEQAAARVESVFGLEPGQAIKRFQILNSSVDGAFVTPQDVKTINIHDSTLQKENNDAGVLAAHEALHIMDATFGITESAHFIRLYSIFSEEAFGAHENLSNEEARTRRKLRSFFFGVNEGSFESIEKGGHAQDNVLELFASFANSLLSENWERVLSESERDFKEWYAEAFLYFQKGITDCNSIPKTAPLFSILEERKASLDDMLGISQ